MEVVIASVELYYKPTPVPRFDVGDVTLLRDSTSLCGSPEPESSVKDFDTVLRLLGYAKERLS